MCVYFGPLNLGWGCHPRLTVPVPVSQAGFDRSVLLVLCCVTVGERLFFAGSAHSNVALSFDTVAAIGMVGKPMADKRKRRSLCISTVKEAAGVCVMYRRPEDVHRQAYYWHGAMRKHYAHRSAIPALCIMFCLALCKESCCVISPLCSLFGVPAHYFWNGMFAPPPGGCMLGTITPYHRSAAQQPPCIFQLCNSVLGYTCNNSIHCCRNHCSGWRIQRH